MLSTLPTSEELKPQIARGASEYLALKHTAESQVVRWVWATGATHCLTPGFDAQILGWPEGKDLVCEPPQRARHFEHGFGSDGHLVVTRAYSDKEGHFTEQFHVYHDGWAERWSFGSHPQYKDLNAVAHYVFDGSRVVGYSSLHAQGESVTEIYEYRGEQLSALRRTGSNAGGALRYFFDYDAAGRINTIRMENDRGAAGAVYQRPARSLAVLLKEASALLLDAIPRCVAAMPITEPAFGLALVYEPGSALSMLPPKLALGLASEREAWRKCGAAREALWDAQGFSTFDDARLEFGSAKLLACMAELAPHLASAAGMDKAHKLLVGVARQLNKLDWNAIAKVTPNFVVYPVDLHMEHLDRDFAAAVSAATLKKLKASPLPMW